MNRTDKIKAIEKVIGAKVDGIWDSKDDTEFQNLINPKSDKKGADVSAPSVIEPQPAGPPVAPVNYS